MRSKPQDAALEEIAGLVRGGAREVVLTGIEVASYGRDLGDTSLEELLCAADALPEVRRYGVRIRLGSLEPSLLRPGFIEKYHAFPPLRRIFTYRSRAAARARLRQCAANTTPTAP